MLGGDRRLGGRRFTWRSRGPAAGRAAETAGRVSAAGGQHPGLNALQQRTWEPAARVSGLVCREMHMHAVGPAGGIGGGGGGELLGRRVRAITGALPSACVQKGSPMAAPGVESCKGCERGGCVVSAGAARARLGGEIKGFRMRDRGAGEADLLGAACMKARETRGSGGQPRPRAPRPHRPISFLLPLSQRGVAA